MIISDHAFASVESLSLCSINFQETAKDAPWTEFITIFVNNPLTNIPETPSFLMIYEQT